MQEYIKAFGPVVGGTISILLQLGLEWEWLKDPAHASAVTLGLSALCVILLPRNRYRQEFPEG